MANPLPDLSNEQKLTYIYHAIKDEESRRMRARWYRLFKLMILAGIAYLVYTYPTQIVTTVSDFVRPIIMEQFQGMIEQNKKSFVDSIKEVLPDSIDIAPTEPSTVTTNKTSSTTSKKSSSPAPKKSTTPVP